MAGKGKNRIQFELGGWDALIEDLDEIGGDVKEVLTDALSAVGEDIGVETAEAMDKINLPAYGAYSSGETLASVVKNPKVEWHGSIAEIGVGFDKVKNGVGSLLITGTPRMRPNYELEKIFVNKTYARNATKDIMETISDAIAEKLEG